MTYQLMCVNTNTKLAVYYHLKYSHYYYYIIINTFYLVYLTTNKIQIHHFAGGLCTEALRGQQDFDFYLFILVIHILHFFCFYL